MIRYVQVAVTVATHKKFMQRSAVFAAIWDNYLKYIITLDEIFVPERNGTQTVVVFPARQDAVAEMEGRHVYADFTSQVKYA